MKYTHIIPFKCTQKYCIHILLTRIWQWHFRPLMLSWMDFRIWLRILHGEIVIFFPLYDGDLTIFATVQFDLEFACRRECSSWGWRRNSMRVRKTSSMQARSQTSSAVTVLDTGIRVLKCLKFDYISLSYHFHNRFISETQGLNTPHPQMSYA